MEQQMLTAPAPMQPAPEPPAVQAIEEEPLAVQPIGPEQLRRLTAVLEKYKAGKKRTERRIVASENWWKLRNSAEGSGGEEPPGCFRSVSGWLHNVIVSKHADAMDAYPEPNLLPRETGDRQEAKTLSAIIPCILEQNDFESVYSDVMWQKLKSGTGCYKIIWDKHKLGGLGDIAVERVNLLNVYWEPGVTDIQRSRYFFHTELQDREALQQQYPELEGRLKGKRFQSARFLYDDDVSTEDKATVIEVYYHRETGGRQTLQYCKYVDDTVLYATENDPALAAQGLYDHGRYPYVFDPLFPIEGSPCGYGFVDICKNPQAEIDLLKTSFIKNAMVGATPRYFARQDGTVNEEEFLDLSRAIVHVTGSLGEESLRQIGFSGLDGTYVNLLDRTIQELRETSGNTETATGNTSSGVTAASAIAALQEASGKGSRDSTKTSYRAYRQIIEFCIELIRQFYDAPRQFRITGQSGQDQFVSYQNGGLQPQHQGTDFGIDMGYRLPVFDIRVVPQKQNAYTRMAQNEMALQFFQLGFFNPQLADQALACLEMMEFEGKDRMLSRISQNSRLFETMQLVEQYAVSLAAKYGDQNALAQLQSILAQGGGTALQPAAAAQPSSVPQAESSQVQQARARAGTASQPGGSAS